MQRDSFENVKLTRTLISDIRKDVKKRVNVWPQTGSLLPWFDSVIDVLEDVDENFTFNKRQLRTVPNLVVLHNTFC